MHTNPFSPTGYDLSDIKRQLHGKVDQHEIYTLRITVDRLESSLREACSNIDGLRSRCERLEESCQELIKEYNEANKQFGVGA